MKLLAVQVQFLYTNHYDGHNFVGLVSMQPMK